LTVNDKGVPSNADGSSRLSVSIAKGITSILETDVAAKSAGQTSGSQFELINIAYIEETFLKLNHIYPGHWDIQRLGNNNRACISNFEQYSHLLDLSAIAKSNPALAAALGNDYTITQDIIIARPPYSDEEINALELLVDDTV
jgi:hypothetical protein